MSHGVADRRPHRLVVRTLGFHPSNRGSIPRGVTSIEKSPIGDFFMLITSIVMRVNERSEWFCRQSRLSGSA